MRAALTSFNQPKRSTNFHTTALRMPLASIITVTYVTVIIAAVGVADSETVYKVLLDGYADDLKFGVAFVLRLIDRGILVEDGQGPIALYFDGDALKHAGVIEGSRVTSKWGAGHLWEHGIWEVPASYGETVERYRLARRDLIELEFEAYGAEILGAGDEPSGA